MIRIPFFSELVSQYFQLDIDLSFLLMLEDLWIGLPDRLRSILFDLLHFLQKLVLRLVLRLYVRQ